MDNFSSNLVEINNSLIALSSGTGEDATLVSVVFGFLKNAGDWADAVAKLIGLVK